MGERLELGLLAQRISRVWFVVVVSCHLFDHSIDKLMFTSASGIRPVALVWT